MFPVQWLKAAAASSEQPAASGTKWQRWNQPMNVDPMARPLSGIAMHLPVKLASRLEEHAGEVRLRIVVLIRRSQTRHPRSAAVSVPSVCGCLSRGINRTESKNKTSFVVFRGLQRCFQRDVIELDVLIFGIR